MVQDESTNSPQYRFPGYEARQARSCRSSLLHSIASSHSNGREGHTTPAANSVSTPRPRYVVEIYAGSASAAVYHLDVDPHARALLVDILPESEMRALIDPAYHSRITFVSDFDVKHLTVHRLQQLVQDAWSVPLAAVEMIWASPQCTYMSRAHHGKKLHYIGNVLWSTEAQCDHA